MKKVLITLPLPPKRLAAINQYITADCIAGAKDLYEEVAERIADYEGVLFLGPMKKGMDAALLAKARNLKIISKSYYNLNESEQKSSGFFFFVDLFSFFSVVLDFALEELKS